MKELILEICERLTRLETQFNHIIDNELKHLKRWVWGLYATIIGGLLYIIVRDILKP